MLFFEYLERRPVRGFHVIDTVFDDYIPFCEYFIVPYLLWFPYQIVTVLYFIFRNKNKKEYYFKRKERQIEEAKNIAIKYYQNTGRLPDLKVLREYSFLFGNKLNSTVEKVLRDSGHFEKCLKTFKEHKPEFDSVDNFLEYCEIKKRKDL